jgi:hypothetical protein
MPRANKYRLLERELMIGCTADFMADRSAQEPLGLVRTDVAKSKELALPTNDDDLASVDADKGWHCLLEAIGGANVDGLDS